MTDHLEEGVIQGSLAQKRKWANWSPFQEFELTNGKRYMERIFQLGREIRAKRLLWYRF